MAKACIQCDKKIGLFQKPVEGIYCSEACHSAAKAQIVEHERVSQERIVESQRISQEMVQREAQKAVDSTRRATCPKCGKPWSYVAGGGPDGTNRGDCSQCGFSVSFVDIEMCQTCRGFSMMVQADESARCPRCKSRRQ